MAELIWTGKRWPLAFGSGVKSDLPSVSERRITMVSTRITVKNTEKKIEVRFERKGIGFLDEFQILR